MKIKDLIIKTNTLEVPMLLCPLDLLYHGCWRTNAEPFLTGVHIFFVGGIVTIATFVDTATRAHHLKHRISMHGIADHIRVAMNEVLFIMGCVVSVLEVIEVLNQGSQRVFYDLTFLFAKPNIFANLMKSFFIFFNL